MVHVVKMTLKNLIVGGGPIPSAIILQPDQERSEDETEREQSELVLPISVGTVDAANVEVFAPPNSMTTGSISLPKGQAVTLAMMPLSPQDEKGWSTWSR